MGKSLKTEKRTTPLPRTEPCADCIVIQSHGFGVESEAILERWDAEPESRPFVDWNQLIVISAQVGEEHRNDTIVNCEKRMLAILRKHNVRYVELARRGFLEEDGIVVLQDTRQPYKLHPEGVYSLSEYLLHSGTVPQFGGEHRCAMKFKAYVIETWLAYAFAHLDNTTPVYHVFGYNADEVSRTTNSDHHIARHNADKLIHAPKPPLMVFGFNSEEIGRSERSMKYDGPSRTGHYPLDEWGWTRQKCIDYILEKSGILWVKSACSFCPFCAEASKGEESARIRWEHSPEQTARGLLVEYNSLCFNSRGHLYRDRALIDVILAKKMEGALVAFAKMLDEIPWALYRVRRIYTKKGKAMRYVEKMGSDHKWVAYELGKAGVEHLGSRAQAMHLFDAAKKTFGGWAETKRGITYLMQNARVEDVYPTREGFYVVAPAFMEDKLRGDPANFNERWERVGKGLPMNPTAEEKAAAARTKKLAKENSKRNQMVCAE
jgi:hypothetical protein